jgi:hypothetical protein
MEWYLCRPLILCPDHAKIGRGLLLAKSALERAEVVARPKARGGTRAYLYGFGRAIVGGSNA